MVYLTHKWKNNRKYLYLEEKARIEGKVKRVFQIYLGPEDGIRDRQILLQSKKLQTSTYNAGSAILWKIAQDLDFSQIISSHTAKTRNQGISTGDLLTVAVINRCLQPCSKNALSKWLERDYLGLLYPEEISLFDSQTYWNHFQYFTPQVLEDIQAELLKKLVKLVPLDLDCLLYDPTNFFTHQSYHAEDQLAKFGNSKENALISELSTSPFYAVRQMSFLYFIRPIRAIPRMLVIFKKSWRSSPIFYRYCTMISKSSLWLWIREIIMKKL
jgi:hypothetical protein